MRLQANLFIVTSLIKPEDSEFLTKIPKQVERIVIVRTVFGNPYILIIGTIYVHSTQRGEYIHYILKQIFRYAQINTVPASLSVVHV